MKKPNKRQPSSERVMIRLSGEELGYIIHHYSGEVRPATIIASIIRDWISEHKRRRRKR